MNDLILHGEPMPSLDGEIVRDENLIQSGEIYYTTIEFKGIEENPKNLYLMYAKSITDAGVDSIGHAFRDSTDPDGKRPLNYPVQLSSSQWSRFVKFGVAVSQLTPENNYLMSNKFEFALAYHYFPDSNRFVNEKLVASRFWLTYIQDGVVYDIDDLWIAFGQNKLYFFKNWMDRGMVDFTKPGQTIQLLAWRGTDSSSRCVVELTSGNYSGGNLDITVKYAGELQIGTNAKNGLAFDEFNLAVADLIRDEFHNRQNNLKGEASMLCFRDLIGLEADRDYLPSAYMIPVFEEYGPTEFACSSVEIDPDTLRTSFAVDYSSSTVMSNNTTEVMTFKTPEYSHKHVETTQLQTNITVKQTGKLTFKGTEKLTIDEKVSKEELGIENTIEVGWEVSGTRQETKTTSDEKTYTCPGQTVAVPPGKSYQATCVWKKSSIEGHIDTFYPMTEKPSLSAVMIQHSMDGWRQSDVWTVAKIKTKLELPALEKRLGRPLGSLQMRTPKANGLEAPQPSPCVLQRFSFKSDAGILSEFTVKQTGDKK